MSASNAQEISSYAEPFKKDEDTTGLAEASEAECFKLMLQAVNAKCVMRALGKLCGAKSRV